MSEPLAYLHGHDSSVLRSHRWRTVENSAAYLLGHLRRDSDVLDVGCGPGTITVGLAARADTGTVVGVDASESVVLEARAEAAARSVGNVTFEVGDLFRLRFDDSTFGVVHAHQVLQHLTDPVAALAEMRRVCVPGGVVAVRDADYGRMCWVPEVPGLDEWRDLYLRVARSIGGEPEPARHMLAWARAAGFGSIEMTVGLWTFVRPEDREWWGTSWADRLVRSSFAEHATSRRLADTEKLEYLSEEWRRWAGTDEAMFVVPHTELLCFC